MGRAEGEVEDAVGLGLRHLLVDDCLLVAHVIDEEGEGPLDGDRVPHAEGAGDGAEEVEDGGGAPVPEPRHGGELLGLGPPGHEEVGHLGGLCWAGATAVVGLESAQLLVDQLLYGPPRLELLLQLRRSRPLLLPPRPVLLARRLFDCRGLI